VRDANVGATTNGIVSGNLALRTLSLQRWHRALLLKAIRRIAVSPRYPVVKSQAASAEEAVAVKFAKPADVPTVLRSLHIAVFVFRRPSSLSVVAIFVLRASSSSSSSVAFVRRRSSLVASCCPNRPKRRTGSLKQRPVYTSTHPNMHRTFTRSVNNCKREGIYNTDDLKPKLAPTK
jgi:hypothetical protein